VILVAVNFTPVARHGYRIGVPREGWWREVLNSDATDYWGQGLGNFGGLDATPTPSHGHPFSLEVTLPPLSVVFFKSEGGGTAPVLRKDAEDTRRAEAAETPPGKRTTPRKRPAARVRPKTRKPPARRRRPSGKRPGRAGK
jgi:hypothetical protein